MRYVDRSKFETPQVMKAVPGLRAPADDELVKVAAYIKKKAKLRAKAESKRAQAKADGKRAPNVTVTLESPFKLYKHDSVRARLIEMFHRKCAYCESFYYATSAMEVEHYRPKEAVFGDAVHQGYWWLGVSWDNLLPSCIYCNQRRTQILPKGAIGHVGLLEDAGRFTHERSVTTGKGTHFPVLGPRVTDSTGDYSKELPLLLNPCKDNPQDHLGYCLESVNTIALMLARPGVGVIPPNMGLDPKTLEDFKDELARTLKFNLDLRGSVSILIYGLNRLGLVQERTRVLRQLMFLELQVVELTEYINKLELRPPGSKYAAEDKVIAQGLEQLRDRTVQQMKSMAKPQAPYSMMVRAYLEDFAARLA
ncbi:HNH endonuclease [Pseudomonas allii]|uniref:HNH endonuclease n=2 Tax=Pseudomonas allii TaxID=2740531 RepID=A0ACC6LG68_9PSED|nr:HNH endonuclease [Pseudomonas allii]KTB57396.1 hypothetical protein AO066_13135 [Pseudomonas fluorescens]MDR9877286.1 HNH endonuclease [Pseudomonas allii]NWN46315.1 HNH endonuclease [Pseudomonas allii]NWN60757.1 HNH endonuclease [Pseudomonas allii]RMP85152.1 hypothetical protein ALQ17_00381 [Pseudomonas fluorescens]